MTILQFELILVLATLLRFSYADKLREEYGYNINSVDGSTYILTVTERVSPEIKAKIAELDGAEAYNEFLKAYGAALTSPKLLTVANPDVVNTIEKKNKKNFVKSLQQLKEHNKKYNSGQSRFKMGANSFSVMDKWERKRFLGGTNQNSTRDNIPAIDPNKCRDRAHRVYCNGVKLEGMCKDPLKAHQCEKTCEMCGKLKIPETLDWNSRGYVTGVKNQQVCGSCWTFAAVGVIEYVFKKTTGKLQQFSEQELLDCSYESESNYNGCEGGLYTAGWDYIIKTGRLATVDLDYTNYDGACLLTNMYDRMYPSPLRNSVRITGYRHIPAGLDITEDLVIDAIQLMPLAVAVYVKPELTDNLFELNEGVFDECLEAKQANHAVLLTGYGPDYWEIKNSWGVDWGRNGFGRLERRRGSANTCLILNHVYYVEYEDLNEEDGMPDIPLELVEEEVECTDLHKDCKEFVQSGYCKGKYEIWMTANCAKSCDICFITCPPGHYAAGKGGDAECMKCEVNTWNNKEGQKRCTPCSSGAHSPAGSTSEAACMECTPGTYLSTSTGRCETCPLDTYSGYGSASCTGCPSGTRSKPGSKTSSDCLKPSPECVDILNDCNNYLKKGACTKRDDQVYMKWGCKKTCRFCTVPPTTTSHPEDDGSCQDIEDDCPQWEKDGYCKIGHKYHKYMVTGCRQSCQTCKKSTTCTYKADTATYCYSWKSQGYCSNSYYRSYMKTNCATTCRFCTQTTVRAQQKGSCKDSPGIACGQFAQQGYCSGYYKSYMQSYCKSTCGMCGNTCEDKRTECRGWAQANYCATNPYYMRENCASSCNTCVKSSTVSSGTSSSSSCSDLNRFCADWSRRGYCSSNHGYMKIYCRKSCRLCSSSSGVSSTSASCRDTDTSGNCASWAASQQCNYNPGYMRVNCQKSCGVCKSASKPALSKSVASSSCVDSNVNCASWAANHQCSYNPNYMRVSCKKSCGVCSSGGLSSVSRTKSCVDKSNLCRSYRNYCYQRTYMYRNWLITTCKATCRNLC